MREVIDALERLGKPRVLVVGDLILDHYVNGAVDRISPEAPIQVLAVRAEEDRLGGAGNVAANLAELGAETYLVGVLGQDAPGDRYLQLCKDLDIRLCELRVAGRPTTCKTRYLAQGQQVLRVDREVIAPLDPRDEEALLDIALEQAGLAEAILISDYAKGALPAKVLQMLFSKARKHGIKALVDPKRTDFGRYYSGASLIKPNRREASLALGRPLDDDEALHRGMDEMIANHGLEAVVVTLGPEGIAYQEKGAPPARMPARARAVFDVSGAGDTVLAVLGLMLAGGRSLTEAVAAANEAGGVVVGKVGTAPVTRAEIRQSVDSRLGVEQGKVIDAADLVDVLSPLRERGMRVAFTNGCFDILHVGHVTLLEKARDHGDLLVVAINSDASVRRLKGEDRPVNPQRARGIVLGGLEAVDYVVVFDEDTPESLLRQIRPDVLVKGGDWQGRGGIVGAEIVEGYGGVACYVDEVPGHSSTRIIEQLGGEDAARDALADTAEGSDEGEKAEESGDDE